MFLKEKHAHSSGTLILDLRDGREIGQRDLKHQFFSLGFIYLFVFLNERKFEMKMETQLFAYI